MSLAALVQTLMDLPAELSAEYDTTADADALAIVLEAIRDCRADLQALYKQVEDDLIATAGSKRFVVDGLGEVEIRSQTKRSQWDHEGLTRLLVAMAADERRVDTETGEFEREADAVARVLTECAGIGYWRVTPLRARHIQVDEYCSQRDGGYAVQLPPRRKI